MPQEDLFSHGPFSYCYQVQVFFFSLSYKAVFKKKHSQFLYLLCLDSGLPANIQLDIDGDRETERIYSLFSLYMGKLEKMQGESGPWAPTMESCELG